MPTSGTGLAPTDGPGQAQGISVGPTTPPNPSALLPEIRQALPVELLPSSIPANPGEKGENQTFSEPPADKPEQNATVTQDEAMKEDKQNNENKKSEESGPKTDQEEEQMKD
eukprot:3795118-Rhodomonas_salina.1